ncbi:DUF1080 domain-containing protein [Planctomycetota bacterium]
MSLYYLLSPNSYLLDTSKVIVLLLACLAGCATRPPPEVDRCLFDGRSLGDWRPSDFGSGQGEVTIRNGMLVLHQGNDLTGVTWTGPLVRMNYEISLEAQRVTGEDFFCGLTFPVGPQHCSLIVGGWSGYLTGLSCLDGFDGANNITTTAIAFENQRWYTIRLRVTPHEVQVWIDGVETIVIDPSEYYLSVRHEVESSRPLGIATWCTTGALRDIRLRKIP